MTDRLTRNVVENGGEQGERWLTALPELVEEVTAEWGVRVLKTYAMTFHWVAQVARPDGSTAVLKLGVADGHLDAEAEALRIFDGRGAVRLLASDSGKGAFLIERADPGTPVTVEDEDVLVEVGRRLHHVPPEGCALPHLRTLPGGDPGYDGGAMLYNPDPERRDPELLARVPARLERLARYQPMDRVVAWGFVMGVLSQVWTGERETRALDMARRLEPRLT